MNHESLQITSENLVKVEENHAKMFGKFKNIEEFDLTKAPIDAIMV